MGRRKGISDDYRRRWDSSVVHREDSLVHRVFQIAAFEAGRPAAVGCEMDLHSWLSWWPAVTVTNPLSTGSYHRCCRSQRTMQLWLWTHTGNVTIGFACTRPFVRWKNFWHGQCLSELAGGDDSEVVEMLVGCQKESDGDGRRVANSGCDDNRDISPEISMGTHIKWINQCPAK